MLQVNRSSRWRNDHESGKSAPRPVRTAYRDRVDRPRKFAATYCRGECCLYIRCVTVLSISAAVMVLPSRRLTGFSFANNATLAADTSKRMVRRMLSAPVPQDDTHSDAGLFGDPGDKSLRAFPHSAALLLSVPEPAQVAGRSDAREIGLPFRKTVSIVS